MNKVMLSVRNIQKDFEGRKVLKGVSFDLEEGSILSVFGSNGAGKTTLLRIIALLDRPSAGSLFVNGIEATTQTYELRSLCGFVAHSPMLYLDLSAEENLLFVAQLYGVTNPKERVSELLELIELTHRRNDRLRDFSRGMIQRVSLARALVHNPPLLLLDEPYSGLDPHASKLVDNLLDQGKHTTIMVCHNISQWLSIGTHFLVLHKGIVAGYEKSTDFDIELFQEHYGQLLG